jgi:predicted nucleic acid-binding protein
MPGDFFDSNILLYVASGDDVKADRAEGLLAAGGVISVQVLNEITSVARRKMRLSWSQAREFLRLVRSFLEVRPVTIEIHEAGLDYAERYGLGLYDAFIVAAAIEAGCETLWSEDMHDGLLIDGKLRIINPFRQA